MSTKIRNSNDEVTIYSTNENFIITVTDKKDDVILEQAELAILTLGKLWKGTTQDHGAIQSYAQNAFNLIAKYGIGTGEELIELQQLLQHFGQVVTIPAPQATYERGKEMAMISCIMTSNFFDQLTSASNNGGSVNCYDLIATWAAEFYDKYKDQNWEDVPAEFPDATGWEDSIVHFTVNKMKSYPPKVN